MSAGFNQCSHLVDETSLRNAQTEYDFIRSCKEDPLQTMLNMQKSLQVALAERHPDCNKNPDELETCGEILQWMRNQDDYLADETRELYTSLGGMSNGEKAASAVWKPWKADHLKMQNTKFADLSDSDKLEVQFELIDQFHFFMNKIIALGLSAEDVFTLYFLKNAENFARQERGY